MKIYIKIINKKTKKKNIKKMKKKKNTTKYISKID